MMLRCAGMFLVLVTTAALAQQGGAPAKERYAVKPDPKRYPQDSPEATMKSVVKAIDSKDLEYWTAHLIDPAFVDAKVNELKTKLTAGDDNVKSLEAFAQFTAATGKHLAEDPSIIRELRRFAKEAEWTTTGNSAEGVVKEIETRKVFLRKVNGRWTMENRQK